MEYYIIYAVLSGILVDVLLVRYLNLNKYPYTVILSIIAMLTLTKTFDDLMIIKGFLFAEILIFTAYVDLKTKTIPDIVHILIIAVSLINPHLYQLAGLLIVPVPFLIPALLKGNSIGGGDIKMMGGIGFFLGVKKGFLASIIGLIFAIAVNEVYYKLKQKDRSISFPLAPYLGLGGFLSFLLQ
ncbi:MAG: A24 family peptidase [Clostridia bacterium]|nr:A24 family peptidase [Clostridia bacterium]